MDRLDLNVVSFGATTDNTLILKDGSVAPRTEDTIKRRENLHKVVSRIHAFSEKFRENSSLFIDAYPTLESLRTWKEQKAQCQEVCQNIDFAKMSATGLRKRLKEHRNRTQAEIDANHSLLAPLTDFFKRKKVKALQKLIDQLKLAKANFKIDFQIRPTVPLRAYVDKESYKELLATRGVDFIDPIPVATVNAIALFGEQHPELTVRLKEEGVIDSDEEKQEFTNLILFFLTTRYPPAVIQIIHSKFPTITTGRAFQEATQLAANLTHMHSKPTVTKFLTDLGFKTVLSESDFDALASHFGGPKQFYLNGTIPLTDLDRELLGQILNDYLRTKGDHSDITTIYEAKIFAETLANIDGNGHETSPMTKERAKQLLRNLGYPDGPLLNGLSTFLKNHCLTLHNYALLSDSEILEFNTLVLIYFSCFNELRAFQTRHQGQSTLISKDDVIKAYQLIQLDQKEVKKKTRSLLNAFNVDHSFSDAEIQRLGIILKDHGFNFSTTSYDEEVIRLFNECFAEFLEEKFPNKSELISRSFIQDSLSLDLNLLLTRCINQPAPESMVELLGAKEFSKIGSEIFPLLLNHLDRSQFYIRDPFKLTQSEQLEFEFILRQFLNEQFPGNGIFIATTSVANHTEFLCAFSTLWGETALTNPTPVTRVVAEAFSGATAAAGGLADRAVEQVATA